MKFVVARPDVVRAINQRWLLKFWTRHLGTNAVPQWAAVEATDFTRMSDNLSFLDVVGTGAGLGFLIRLHGDAHRAGLRLDRLPRKASRAPSFPRAATRRDSRPTTRRSRRAARSTPSTTSPTATAAWCITSGCCCRSRATARPSTASSPRSSSSASTAASMESPDAASERASGVAAVGAHRGTREWREFQTSAA